MTNERSLKSLIRYYNTLKKDNKRSERKPSSLHLFGRMIYTFVAWTILGIGITPTSFFPSVCLFVAPVMMDCVQFYYNGWIKKKFVLPEAIFCSIWTIFTLSGLLGALVVVQKGDDLFISIANNYIVRPSFLVPIWLIWTFLLSVPVVTMADFGSRKTKGE